jgi:molybdopterin/thiamine biosynthesis adenylyltransferase
VLAGIGSLTLIDEKICSLNDYGTQFFIKKDHVDKKTNRYCTSTKLKPSYQQTLTKNFF